MDDWEIGPTLLGAVVAVGAVWVGVELWQFFAADIAKGTAGTGAATYSYRDKTELVYFWASVVLLIAAVATALVVRNQLVISQRQQWADIILTLDERFNDTHFTQSRQSAEDFMRRIRAAVDARHPDLSVDRPSAALFEAIATEWRELENGIGTDPENRTEEQKSIAAGMSDAFAAVDYCETIGLLVDRKFVRFDDIESLLGGWIQTVYTIMEGPVGDLRRTYDDDQIYKNFSSIGRRCIAIRERRDRDRRGRTACRVG